jgi:hypothetical protein
MSARSNRRAYPPTINAVPIYQRKLRFRATGATAVINIYRRDLLNLIYTGITGATTGVVVIGACLVEHVEMWAYLNSGDVTTTTCSCDLTWTSNNGPDNRMEDIGNAMRPAHVSMAPPKNSLASFWSNSNSTLSEVLFQLNSSVPAGGFIVDVSIRYTINDGQARTVASGAFGSNNVLINNLDNSTSVGGQYVSSNLVPQGVTNAQAWG